MKNLDDADVGSIEREIYIEASPATVFDVVSRPEHVAQWWPDDATYEMTPGSAGEITFGDPAAGGKVQTLTVLEVEPPTTFSFAWTHQPGTEPTAETAMFVTFTLTPHGTGTLLRFVETGFRERGWDDATARATFTEHAAGWNHFLPRLAPYAERLTQR